MFSVTRLLLRRHIKYIAYLPYELRLHHLNLYSLYCRRQRGALIDVYKLVNNFSRVTPQPFFVFTNSITRGHNQRIIKQQCRLTSRLNFFTNSVINQWNSLPEYVIESANLNNFKNNLDLFRSITGYGQTKRPLAY